MIADRYRIERMIAKGGMGTVYLARQLPLNRLVALKTLKPSLEEEEERQFAGRFRLEAEALASLKHPNIVTIYDYGNTPSEGYFLAMEYVDGPRFNDLLKGGKRPPPEKILRLSLQICSALQYAHRRGIIHRDIKLSNILVETDEFGHEHIKVVDFGLVKLEDVDHDLTRAGTVLRISHFMAPEQIREDEVDHRVDIYAVGVLLFSALMGQYPFHGDNKASTIAAHLTRPIPTFHEVQPDLMLPLIIEEVVRRCLAKDPEDRYPDMSVLIADLQRCLEALGGFSSDPAISEDSLKPTMNQGASAIPAWSLPLIVGGLLFVAFAIIALSFGFLISASTPERAITGPAAIQSPPERVHPAVKVVAAQPTEEPETDEAAIAGEPAAEPEPALAEEPATANPVEYAAPPAAPAPTAVEPEPEPEPEEARVTPTPAVAPEPPRPTLDEVRDPWASPP